MKNPIDPFDYPNCYEGFKYAIDVRDNPDKYCLSIGWAVSRFFKDIERTKSEDCTFFIEYRHAERFLKLVQKFNHAKGVWKDPRILYEPWQKFKFMNLFMFTDKRTMKRRFRSAYCGVPRGNGKALSLDTKIPTPNGIKLFKDIKVGDYVYSRDGKPTEVVAETDIHIPPTQYLMDIDGIPVKASAEHLWFTTDKLSTDRFNRHSLRKVVEPRDYVEVRDTRSISRSLKKWNQSNHSIELPKKIQGNKEALAIDPYTLGYWIGNGDKNSGRITCNLDDQIDVEARVNKVYDTKDYPDNGHSCTIRVIGLTTLLKSENITSKLIPTKYLTTNSLNRMLLLRGLLDSDGFISPLGQVEFSSVHEELADQVVFLISSLGFKCQKVKSKISDTNNYRTANSHYYRVMFTPRTALPLFSIQRKRERQIPSRGTHSYTKKRYIKNVVECEELEPMKCITVEGDGSFLITEHCVVTHNSAEASQIGLYFLALDGENGPEVVCASTKKEAARIVFDSSRVMANKNKSFLKSTGTRVMAHTITHPKSNGIMKPLSSDPKSQDGLNPNLIIGDEIHEWNRALYDVLDSAVSKRNDSLFFMISTAGFNTEGIGHEIHAYTEKVLKGEVEDDTWFGNIYQIDSADLWLDPEHWAKANPNWGVSVDPINIAAKAKKAQETPASKNNFLVKHLNIWTNQASPFFSLKHWDECEDKSIKLEQFVGNRGYLGLDLSSKIDLTCLFYSFAKDDKIYLFDKSFVPEARVMDVRNTSYAKWVEEGWLLQHKGEVINFEDIENTVIKDNRKFNLSEIFFDPWSGYASAQKLEKNRVNVTEFRMTVGNLSEPMKLLDAWVREKRIVHNGSPLLRWCLGNVVAKEDANGNVFPRKEHERLKIDLAVAAIMSIAGHIRDIENRSIYETRGLRVM